MLLCCKQFYTSLDKSVRQGILFSDLLLAGTPFWIFPPKVVQECAEPFCVVTGDDSSHSQGQSGKRLLLASKGHPVRTTLYHGSCIDPTHQFHTLDPTTQVPFPIPQVPIKLLIKDFHYIGINRTRNMANLLKKGIFKNAWFSHNQIYGMQIDLSIE